ncbi:FAD-dependent pyridine nucleotide-disulfide oxidoreductase domain protein, partial [mine drainage metagenome]
MKFVIIGGGPAGVEAATHAARMGAEVVLIERDIVGGAANLWDCIPSKAMISTGAVLALTKRAEKMGLMPITAQIDLDSLKSRVSSITGRLAASKMALLKSQGVTIINGVGRM